MIIFAFPSRTAWVVLAITGTLAFGGLAAMGVTILLAPLAVTLAGIFSCLAGCAFYTHVRPDRRLAVLLAGTAFLLSFAATTGTLTYPAAAVGGALHDQTFIAFERMIGVDWPSLARLMTENPILNFVWAFAYWSSLPLIAIAVLMLGFTDRHDRLAVYLSLLATTLIATVALAAIAPALGPIPSYGIEGDLYARLGGGGKTFLSDFMALRQGRFTVLDISKLEGIVTFPSFHCVLAILTGWALAPVRWVGRPIVALNFLVILSTVPQGGHYIADIVAGSLIALIALAAQMRMPSAVVTTQLLSTAAR